MSITQKDEPSDVPAEIKPMIENYKPNKANVNSSIEMKIQLTDETPVIEPLRRLPYAHREIVEKRIKEWTKDGVVIPPYACNVLVTKKKDDSDRVCIDYRPVNKK